MTESKIVWGAAAAIYVPLTLSWSETPLKPSSGFQAIFENNLGREYDFTINASLNQWLGSYKY